MGGCGESQPVLSELHCMKTARREMQVWPGACREDAFAAMQLYLYNERLEKGTQSLADATDYWLL